MADVKPTNPSAADAPTADDVRSKENQEARTVPYGRFSEVVNERNRLREKLELLQAASGEGEDFTSYRETVNSLAHSELKSLAEVLGLEKFNEAVETFELEKLSPLEKLEKIPRVRKFFLEAQGASSARTTGGGPVRRGGSQASRIASLRGKSREQTLSLAERKEYLRLLRRVKKTK